MPTSALIFGQFENIVEMDDSSSDKPLRFMFAMSIYSSRSSFFVGAVDLRKTR